MAPPPMALQGYGTVRPRPVSPRDRQPHPVQSGREPAGSSGVRRAAAFHGLHPAGAVLRYVDSQELYLLRHDIRCLPAQERQRPGDRIPARPGPFLCSAAPAAGHGPAMKPAEDGKTTIPFV
jgi:hypothetical protein